MNGIILTQNSTPIIGQVAWLLGKIMEGIFTVLDVIGIPNSGLSIILFTIIVNLLMLPLTIKQQKFSKLSAKMNPEIQAIQKKYKNKKDNDSMVAQNQEMNALYAKYGVSPTGSCMYLLIQMPILFALYRVIYSMPAYVGKIKEAFFPLVDKLIATEGASEFIQNLSSSAMYAKQFSSDSFISGNVVYVENTLIDCLNKASTADFMSIADNFPALAEDVAGTVDQLGVYNNFLGLNIGNSPWYIIQESIGNGAWLLAIGALMIPLLSALTQWINVKLMPRQNEGNKKDVNDQAAAMEQSMKMMNMTMPLFSAWLCFTLPSGMGIYWVAGSVVRSIQQIVINKHIDKMDFDDIIRKNSEKSAKKLEKVKAQQEKFNAYANMNAKNIQKRANIVSGLSDEEKEQEIKKSTEYYNNSTDAKPGSMRAKANMVKQYNERYRK